MKSRRLALSLVFYPLGWAALTATWLLLIGALGVPLYRELFGFDALDHSQWTGLVSFFRNGGAIPLDFAALTIGLALSWLAGALVFIGRRHSLARGVLWTLAVVDWSGLVAVSIAAAAWVSHGWKWALRAMSNTARRLADGRGRIGGRPAPTGMVDGGATERGTAIIPSQAKAEDAGVKSPGATEPTAAAAQSTLVGSRVSGSAREAADAAALGRAVVLVDVWVDPPPQWLDEALREEVEAVSADGWGSLVELGGAGRRLLDVMTTYRILPGDPQCSAAVGQLVAAQAAEPDSGGRGQGLDDGGDGPVDDTAKALPPNGGPGLTLSAAWLCDLLDNHAMLEDYRRGGDADQFEEQWGAVYRQTRSQLAEAMRAMDERDWASLDRFPDRAGRARVLTDRLREEFRRPVVSAETAEPTKAETPPPRPMASPADPAAPSATRKLEAVLAAHGFAACALPDPFSGAPPAAADLLAHRGDLGILLRLHFLGDVTWKLDAGYLAAWQAPGCPAIVSPCRDLWRRLALMRSMGKPRGELRGIIVVFGGAFADEAPVAAAVHRERDRTGVEIVWLDEVGHPLPSLTPRLAELSGDPPEGGCRPLAGPP